MTINPATQDAAAYAALRVGFTTEKGAATLPAGTTDDLFTIAGGRVLASFIGEVTVVIQTQANATNLLHNPAAGTTTDLCGTLDITADEVGLLYGLTGTAGDAMIGLGKTVPLGNPIVLQEGVVELECAATNTGATKWTCYWIPLDDGATVTAA